MRTSWPTLGMYCGRIEHLDWGASCMLRIYGILTPVKLAYFFDRQIKPHRSVMLSHDTGCQLVISTDALPVTSLSYQV